MSNGDSAPENTRINGQTTAGDTTRSVSATSSNAASKDTAKPVEAVQSSAQPTYTDAPVPKVNPWKLRQEQHQQQQQQQESEAPKASQQKSSSNTAAGAPAVSAEGNSSSAAVDSKASSETAPSTGANSNGTHQPSQPLPKAWQTKSSNLQSISPIIGGEGKYPRSTVTSRKSSKGSTPLLDDSASWPTLEVATIKNGTNNEDKPRTNNNFNANDSGETSSGTKGSKKPEWIKFEGAEIVYNAPPPGKSARSAGSGSNERGGKGVRHGRGSASSRARRESLGKDEHGNEVNGTSGGRRHRRAQSAGGQSRPNQSRDAKGFRQGSNFRREDAESSTHHNKSEGGQTPDQQERPRFGGVGSENKVGDVSTAVDESSDGLSPGTLSPAQSGTGGSKQRGASLSSNAQISQSVPGATHQRSSGNRPRDGSFRSGSNKNTVAGSNNSNPMMAGGYMPYGQFAQYPQYPISNGVQVPRAQSLPGYNSAQFIPGMPPMNQAFIDYSSMQMSLPHMGYFDMMTRDVILRQW